MVMKRICSSGLSRKAPVKVDVPVTDPCLRMPRIAMHIVSTRTEDNRVGTESGFEPVARDLRFGKANHDQSDASTLAFNQRIGG